MHRRITGKLVIATHNPGKLAEMRELLAPHGVEAVSAGELGLGEPEETGDDFRSNASIVATSSFSMARSATRWPDLVIRSASVSPEVSLAAVRVSDTVSTAMFTAMKGRLSSRRAMTLSGVAREFSASLTR